jgi:hypothetical protein
MKFKHLKRFSIATIFGGFILLSSCAETKTASQSKETSQDTEMLMRRMDTNKDGKLSKDEVKGPLQNEFSKIDTNDDGFLSKEELESAPKPNRQRPQNVQRPSRQ